LPAFEATFATIGALLNDASDEEPSSSPSPPAAAAAAMGPPVQRLARHTLDALEADEERTQRRIAQLMSAFPAALAAASNDEGGAGAGESAAGASGGEGGDALCGAGGDRAARLAVEHVLLVQAHAAHCTGQLSAAALRALREYAVQSRREADRPSDVQPGADLEPQALLHGVDWPFISEVERAVWKGTCLQALERGFVEVVERLAASWLDSAQQLERSLLRARRGAAPPPEVKQHLRQVSTAVRLDSGAAIALVQEAIQLFEPVLQYVSLQELDVQGQPSLC
jgi:hypothetical protein